MAVDDVDPVLSAKAGKQFEIGDQVEWVQAAVQVESVREGEAAFTSLAGEGPAGHTAKPDSVSQAHLLSGQARDGLGGAGPSFAAGKVQNVE